MSNQRDDDIVEIRTRCRRIETRLTSYMESKGFDTQSKKPVWIEGSIKLPNLSCSIKDILAVIPKDWPDDIVISHDGKDVIEFNLVE